MRGRMHICIVVGGVPSRRTTSISNGPVREHPNGQGRQDTETRKYREAFGVGRHGFDVERTYSVWASASDSAGVTARWQGGRSEV